MLSLTQFANVLRKKFPCSMPVRVRTCRMPITNKKEKLRGFGDASEYETYFIIRISNETDLSVQKDTLMHEWAHCVVGWEDNKETHSAKWGICYSAIYREMVGD